MVQQELPTAEKEASLTACLYILGQLKVAIKKIPRKNRIKRHILVDAVHAVEHRILNLKKGLKIPQGKRFGTPSREQLSTSARSFVHSIGAELKEGILSMHGHRIPQQYSMLLPSAIKRRPLHKPI